MRQTAPVWRHIAGEREPIRVANPDTLIQGGGQITGLDPS
jgi:hypothetical protein